MFPRPLDSVYNHLDNLADPSPITSPSNSFPSDASVPIWFPVSPVHNAPHSLTSNGTSHSPSPPPSAGLTSRFPASHPTDRAVSPRESFPLTSHLNRPQRMSGLSAFGNGSPTHPHPPDSRSGPSSPITNKVSPSSPPDSPIPIPIPVPFPMHDLSPIPSYSRQSISSAPSSPSSVATHLTGLSTARLNPSAQPPEADTDDEDTDSQSISLPPDSPQNRFISGLPEPALWLLGIVVELWIDQEGFRAVKPEFILSRYLRSRSNPAQTIAQFIPRLRQGYHFHYAPLDAPPTLRRLTLNGSQSRDHLGRQAQLMLKSNGVYFVEGEEDRGLHWKFEYIVDDRRGRTGKILSGEKMLTPLTFSCSPELLSPNRGRKIKLFSEMRKMVGPKLTSLKLELPTFATSSKARAMESPMASPKGMKEEATTPSDEDESDTAHTSRFRQRAFSEGSTDRPPEQLAQWYRGNL